MARSAWREGFPLLLALAAATVMYLGVNGIGAAPAWLPALMSVALFAYAWPAVRFAGAGPAAADGDPPAGLFVSVVVPVYNEEPELLRRGLQSLAAQSRLPDRVWVIDDGSDSPACMDLARQWAAECHAARDGRMDVQLVVQPENGGKRGALVRAFDGDSEADVFFTVDSDTLLDHRAVEQGLKPFRDPRVHGVAGVLFGHNRDNGWLTRAVELEFTSGFLLNRAAMSRFGAVLVTCGSLAAYRGDVCRGHRRDLLNEYFLGSRVVNGDDRKLTQFALQRGRVVLAPGCTGRVALPQSASHLFRQRTRWSTSFFRGTVYMLRHMPPTHVAFWLTLMHAGIFGVETAALLAALLLGPFVGWLNLAAIIAAAVTPGIVARHRTYWSSSGVDRDAAGAAEYVLLAPLSLLVVVLVVVPARYYALFHLKSSDWRTRKQVEAVSLQRSGDGMRGNQPPA